MPNETPFAMGLDEKYELPGDTKVSKISVYAYSQTQCAVAMRET